MSAGGRRLAVGVALLVGGRGTAAQELTLREAAELALAAHPSAVAAEARSAAAHADADAAGASYLPALTAGVGLTRFEEPMVVAPLHGFDPTRPPDFDRTLVQSQLMLDYALFEGGARGARSRAADRRAEATSSAGRAVRMALVESVARAYVGVLASREVLAAARRQRDALAAEATRADQRFEQGVAARVDVLRARAAALDASAQIAEAEARAEVAERTLARLLGLDAPSLARRTLVDVVATTTPTATTATEDPRITVSRRALEAARARLDQERAGRLPSLRASAGLSNFGSGAGDFVTEWQAGVRLSWPVFTGGARSASIERAEADVRAAEAELSAAELDALGALDAARADRVAAAARAVALEASVVQWEEVTRIEALGLETGVGAQQDYLRAEAALFQARAGWAQSRYDQVLALVAEARARGGLEPRWLDQALENVR